MGQLVILELKHVTSPRSPTFWNLLRFALPPVSSAVTVMSRFMFHNIDSTYMFQDEKDILAMSTLYSLESTICERKAEILGKLEGKPSWTKKLLLDEKLLCSKIRFVNLYYIQLY